MNFIQWILTWHDQVSSVEAGPAGSPVATPRLYLDRERDEKNVTGNMFSQQKYRDDDVEYHDALCVVDYFSEAPATCGSPCVF